MSSQIKYMSPCTSTFLDLCRWFAAFLVLTGHVRHLLFIDLVDLPQANIVIKGFYFITGFGHEAVVVFFVISGFLVGGITLDRWRLQGPRIIDYLVHRVSRIYTVFIPALIMGFALDWVGSNWFDASGIYANPQKFHTISMHENIATRLGLDVFIGNLLLMGDGFFPILGSNGPLWSLMYEGWYYCLFLLTALAFPSLGMSRYLFLLLIPLAVYVLPIKLVLWMLVWLLGVAAFFVHRFRLIRVNIYIGLFVFFIGLLFSRVSHGTGSVASPESLVTDLCRDLGLGVAYSIALISMSSFDRPLPFAALHKTLAGFSYTTYLTHFPLMVFLVAVGMQHMNLDIHTIPDSGLFITFFGITSVLYLYCYLCSRFTERHTASVRDSLDGLMQFISRRPCDANR